MGRIYHIDYIITRESLSLYEQYTILINHAYFKLNWEAKGLVTINYFQGIVVL